MDTYFKEIKTENNENTSCVINKKNSHIGKNKAGKNSSLEGNLKVGKNSGLEGYSKAGKVRDKGASVGSETLKAYLWSTPSLTLICLIVIFPILYTAYISMTNMNVYHWTNFTFVGLKNYMDALLVFDNGFISALIMTVVWTVVSMVFQLVISFILASLLNVKGLRLRNVYKTLLIFPWAMPGYVSILLWKTGIYNSQFGLLNQWLSKLGMEPVRWLSSNLSAFICCTIVNLWLALPFMMTIMDGAFQSIDKSFYESAVLDGAGWIQKTVYITIPMIKPIIGPSVIITIFTTFKQFDVIYLLTQQVGARSGSDIHTIMTYAYEKAFVTNNYGYSSAVSMLIFVMLVAFTMFTNKMGQKKEDL